MPDTSTVHRFPPQLPVREIATAAQALIDLLDKLGGDIEAEDDDPAEENGDDETASSVEWDKMRAPLKRKPNFTLGVEDAEDDDPAEDNHDREAIDEREPEEGRDAPAAEVSYRQASRTRAAVGSDRHQREIPRAAYH